MEKWLTSQLFLLRDHYCDASGISPVTLGHRCADDGNFFASLEKAEPSTFTVRKLGRVLGWFDANWPADAVRPACLNDWRALQQWNAANQYSNTDPDRWPCLFIPGCGFGGGQSKGEA